MADYILTGVAVDETVPLGAVDQVTDHHLVPRGNARVGGFRRPGALGYFDHHASPRPASPQRLPPAQRFHRH